MYDEFVKCSKWMMFGEYVGRVVWRADGTRTTQLHHRFIVETVHGRRLGTNEHVHHVNGIKTDNRLENLEVLSAAVHAAEHGLERTAASLSEFTCAFCNSQFSRRTKVVAHERARGKPLAGIFCSRSCSRKWHIEPTNMATGRGKKLDSVAVTGIEMMLSSVKSKRSIAMELGLDRETIRKISRGEYWLPVKEQTGSRKPVAAAT